MKLACNTDWTFWKEGSKEKQIVTIPHDAMLHEKRTPDAGAGSSSGFYPGGVYYYEKKLNITKEQLEGCITLEFEGVYKNAEVSVNGELIYKAAYGYAPFYISLNNCINEGENTLLVRADNEAQPDSRWYTGAGIYRPVWLHIQPKEHILLEGVKIHTVSIAPATIEVSIEKTSGKADIEIIDANGKVVATEKGVDNKIHIIIPNATLWSEDLPYLYKAKVTHLSNAGERLETVEEYFGIRMVNWDANGFYINGKNTLLRGGCIHHDNGIVGACAYEESEDRRIRILKENGFNAIRSAHNLCSKAVLRACDKYGVYIMDESWDMWYKHKSKYDYATEFMEHYREDLLAMVRRDYNHPSVVMYSIGNEVSEPAKEKGIILAKEMGDYLRSLDSTRAVTGGFNLMIIKNSAHGKDIYSEEGGREKDNDKQISGMNSTMFNFITSMVGSGMNMAANGKKADEATSPLLATLDISGYNYASGRYAGEGKLHPERIIVGSETFPQDIAKNWDMVKKYPYLIGDFMWTAWDYIGEAGIGTWTFYEDAKGFNKPYPWLLADTGAFDILGNPNGEAMLAKAVWGFAKKPLIGVQPCNQPDKKIIKASWRGTNAIPNWSWANCDGNKVIVEVFTDAAKVELFVNGKKIGTSKVKGYKATFKTKYQTGEICAIAYDASGCKIGQNTLCSATGMPKVSVEAENKNIQNGAIVYYDISLKGDNGIVESNADRKLNVTVKGGELLGFGSANPRTEERFDTGVYTTYYGKAQAVVRVTDVNNLEIIVTE